VFNRDRERAVLWLWSLDMNNRQKQGRFRFILNATGYLSYSIVFNVLNTIVFSALYPKILEHITHGDKKRYNTAFSNINFITTLFSAVTLPFIGSWVDTAHTMKPTMLVTQYLGISCTLLLFFLGKLPNNTYKWQEAQLAFNEILYVLAMFFLRISVMANNAMLPFFNKEHVTVLSLLNSLLGFLVNLFGLLFLLLIPESMLSGEIWGISMPNWLLLLFTVITLFSSGLTWLAPNASVEPVIKNMDEADVTTKEKQNEPSGNFINRHGKIMLVSVKSVVSTFKNWNKKESYFQSWIFLLAYLFYSTSGTVCTIFLGPLFIEIYDLTLSQEVALNLYFKLAMIIGVVLGILFDKFVKTKEILILIFQNTVFAVLLMTGFVFISLKASYIPVLFIFLIIGLLYSWNLSVSRAVISKLLPQDKKCEFMGLYSTFTYLGISIVSLLNSMLRTADLPSHILLLILFIWIIPAYLFLLILQQSTKKSEARHAAKMQSVNNFQTMKSLDIPLADEEEEDEALEPLDPHGAPKK
jgi:MFS-type transporter involved in bile tolerance (Atg22 family)